MFRVLGLGRKSASSHVAETSDDELHIINEGIQLERALLAMDAVMDGQIDRAQALLKAHSNDTFSKIAAGVLVFIEATVGFESDAITEAMHTLEIAEHAAQKDRASAVSKGLKTSSFRPGAEYELVEAEAGLMGAVSRLLTESPVEALKALLKLHKMNQKLEDLRKHVNSVTPLSSAVSTATSPTATVASSTTTGTNTGTTSVTVNDSDPKVRGKLAEFHDLNAKRCRLTGKQEEKIMPQATVDEYIVSGVNTCAGLIQLVVSSVPPNIVRLLSWVGFRGDRLLALEMLWESTERFTNIHSSLALLALLQFFDGQFQFRDIELPQAQQDAISDKYAARAGETRSTAQMTPRELDETRERLTESLKRTRGYYQHGMLWLLQDGRMVANSDLAAGVKILESDECGKSQMRQVEGLLVFDRTLMLLGLNRLEDATNGFVSLMDLSTWSHPLYMYLAGACQIELYRDCEDKKSPEALEHKKRAEEFLRKAPQAMGKKKILGKRMPFDLFVARKVEQFEIAARQYNLDIVDAVGTSPLLEAMYFWNSHARMPKELVPIMLKRLWYSKKAPLPEAPNEKFTRQLLTSVYLRRNGEVRKGMDILNGLVPHVITLKDGHKPKYHAQKDPWAGPVTLYQRAIYEWDLHGAEGAPEVRRWLKLCSGWDEDYELSTRVNMRVTGATDRLDIYRL